MSTGSRQRSEILHAALAKVAPGTPLREGLDRIVRAKMGALLILGDFPTVLNICSGGFLLDSAFSPQRLSELAKMDGAIILGSDATRIARANVHLVPDPTTQTSETGTRHRTAERVARSIAVPVVSVSEEMGVIARKADPHDGRGSLVSLTKSGVRAVDLAMEDLLEREREFLMTLNKGDRALLASMLSKLAAPFDEQI